MALVIYLIIWLVNRRLRANDRLFVVVEGQPVDDDDRKQRPAGRSTPRRGAPEARPLFSVIIIDCNLLESIRIQHYLSESVISYCRVKDTVNHR